MIPGDSKATVLVSLWAESVQATTVELSDRIGLAPDRVHQMGDGRGKTGKTWAHHGWAVEDRAQVPDDPQAVADGLQQSLTCLLRRLGNSPSRFQAATAHCERGLLVGVRASAVPPLRFSAETIAQLAALGVGFEIDLVLG